MTNEALGFGDLIRAVIVLLGVLAIMLRSRWIPSRHSFPLVSAVDELIQYFLTWLFIFHCLRVVSLELVIKVNRLRIDLVAS